MHGFFLAIFLDVNGDIAFNLIEELFGFVVVKILAIVRPTHNHDDVVFALGIQIFIGHRRFEQVAIFVDPVIEIERCAYGHNPKLSIFCHGPSELVTFVLLP